MVRNFIQSFYREERGLHEAAYVLAIFAVGSQLLALIRDRLLAHTFGAGVELDLYYVAFKIPDLLYVIFASTISIYVLIPFVAERIDGVDMSRAKAFLSEILSIFVVGYTLLATCIILAAPYIVALLYPDLTAHHETLTLLIRILLLQPLFLGISSLFSIVTQYHRRFLLYAVSPLIYNLGIIFGILCVYPFIGLPGLVVGVVVGAAGHLLIQIPYVSKTPLAPRVTLACSWSTIRPVLTISIFRAVTLSLHQVLLFVFITIAAHMSEGSVAVFQFAFNLQSVPLTIIGVSYSVAAFPLLARLFAEGKLEEFGENIRVALRHILFWSVPVIALCIVIRAQFVRTILGSGSFDWADTKLTAAVFALFMLSLTAQAIHLLLVRALYAAGNTRLPFIITLISTTGAIGGAVALIQVLRDVPSVRAVLESILRLEGVSGTEVLALPLAYSAALILHSILLVYFSRRTLNLRPSLLFPQVLRALSAAVVVLFASYFALNLIVSILRTETLGGIFVQGLFAGVVGIAAAAVTYRALRSPELIVVYASLRRKIRSSGVTSPQHEDELSV